MPLFIAFYCLLCGVAHFCALPFLFLLSFKQKYKNSLKRRFFNPIFPKSDKEILWFHACSFGEIASLRVILESLHLRHNEQILITTTTQTGFDLAKKTYPDFLVSFLPFESFIPFFVKNLKIKRLILLEAELWLMPLFCAKKHNATTLLLNARISTRSYKKYLKFRFFYQKLFAYIDRVLAQSTEDKERLETLGAKNIEVFGNIKLLSLPQVTKEYEKAQNPLFVIASTHEKEGQEEEILLLEVLLDFLKKTDKKVNIMFVPRHPERFLSVAKKIQEKLGDKKLILASQNGVQNAINSSFSLLDKLGELNNIYAICDLVILGGSFIKKVGGHNPLEPAFFGCKLISGEYIFNQLALFSCIENAVLCKIEDLGNILMKEKEIKAAKIIKSINKEKLLATIKG